jgi:hypothetical protein
MDAQGSGPYRARPGETVDPTQVDLYRGGRGLEVRPGEIKVGADGLVQPTHGISLESDPAALARFGGASRVRSIPAELRVVQRGRRDTHFEVVPRQPMTPERYQELVRPIALG